MVASYGYYAVRLTVFTTGMMINPVTPLWVELYGTCNDRPLDSAGCDDLSEGVAAAKELLTEAKMLNACSNQHAR